MWINREIIYRDQIEFSSRLKPCWGLFWGWVFFGVFFGRTFKLLLLEQTSVDQWKNFAIFFKTSAVVSFCSLLVLCAAMNCHFSYRFCAFCRVWYVTYILYEHSVAGATWIFFFTASRLTTMTKLAVSWLCSAVKHYKRIPSWTTPIISSEVTQRGRGKL